MDADALRDGKRKGEPGKEPEHPVTELDHFLEITYPVLPFLAFIDKGNCHGPAPAVAE